LSPEKNRITIFYHLNEGEIAPICRVYSRSELTGVPSMHDGAEHASKDPEDQIRQQKIYNMEKECINGIKLSENSIKEELKKNRSEVEEKINSYKATNNHEEALKVILEKTLHDKAREK
jgi:hypothetical protein